MTKLVFDENRLTIGDMEDFETATGVELTEALKPVKVLDEDGKPERDPETGKPAMAVKVTAKTLKGLVWIANRHDNPDFTLDDARNTRVTDLEIIRADDDDESAGEADPKD